MRAAGEMKQHTVPSSMYTAVPHAAIVAPNNHITKESPTLPDARRMTLGVANILHIILVGVDALEQRRYLVPIMRLNMRKTVLVRPGYSVSGCVP